MKLPFVLRSHHERELDYVKADRERIRGERNQFEKDRDAFKYTAETVAEKYTDTALVNDRLTEDLAKAREQLAASMDVEGALARQIHEMAQPVEPTDSELDDITRLTRERDSEKQRADLLLSYLDSADMKAIKQWDKRVQAHEQWVRPTNPDDRPYEGGSGRPMHPAVELRRALERCLALQARLDGRGKEPSS